jgi:hypothetical protein
MFRNLSRRCLLAFLLAVLVTMPVNAAQRAQSDLLSVFHGWLTGLWNTVGCSIDPHGACGNTASAPTDRGCGIDPDGRCLARQAPAAANQQEAGCGIDPNGRCAF